MKTYQSVKLIYEAEQIPEGYIPIGMLYEETKLNRDLVKRILEEYQKAWKQTKAKKDRGENIDGWLDDLIDEICEIDKQQ